MIDACIDTFERPNCPQCGATGGLLYADLKDRLFGASGTWDLHRCSSVSCGVIWLSPLPLERELYKVYENYYTHQLASESTFTGLKSVYERACHAYYAIYFGYPLARSLVSSCFAVLLRLIPRRAAHLDFMAFHLPYVNNGKLLEIGCGSGLHLKNMKSLGWNVEGIDIDTKAVDACRASGLPATARTIDDVLASGERYDAVVLSHVIEHVMDPSSFVAKCFDLLNNGGKLVLITPNIESLSHKVFGRYWLPLDPPRHLTLFNCHSLCKTVQQAGFVVKGDSSIRFSDGSFAASLSILRSGSAEMNSYGKFTSVVAKVFQLLHFGAYKISNTAGEELVVIGTKEDKTLC